jgi:hypothetical protein
MSPAEIFDLIAKYGPGVIFALLWWLERGERIDAQKEVKQIAKDSIVAITNAASSSGQLISILKPGQRQ